jgi:protein-arginine kinase activator protein McsA
VPNLEKNSKIREKRKQTLLRRKASTLLRRFVKTTGVCPVCRTYVKLDLSQREFTCPCCNSTFDRDVASAIVILKEGLSLWNVGETPGDENASAMMEYFASIPTRKRIDEPKSHVCKGGVPM